MSIDGSLNEKNGKRKKKKYASPRLELYGDITDLTKGGGGGGTGASPCKPNTCQPDAGCKPDSPCGPVLPCNPDSNCGPNGPCKPDWPCYPTLPCGPDAGV